MAVKNIFSSIKSLFIVIALFLLFFACSSKEQFQIGETYHGFTLTNKKFVEEVNADCLLFKHDKSGARLLKIAADDTNKLFDITFKTVPETDYGTPHIMEHSVLNGSKNFPVKSPFDVLMQGSLNTFLNAMTGSDITTYPVASMNDKDYFNLMHVYLDAVFNPLIYDDPKILQQEGWHYELTGKEDDVVYKGVVYNEMKGAYSSPERELDYQINKILFPDNTYGFTSGGHPDEIPKLTYDHFLNFHKKFYHPSNSYIFLYGDADLNQELQFIDSKYLFEYNLSDQKVEIPLQKPFDEMKEAEKTYAVPEGAPTDEQTFLTLSFVAGQSTDRALLMTLRVLTEALVNHESGPIRLALQEAGIGKDVRAYSSESLQNVFQITVRNANPEDKDRFKEIVFNTLKKVSQEGFDKSMIAGILNRMEFNLKEGDTPQKGLRYLLMAYNSWFFADDPFLGLEFNIPLTEVKKAMETKLLQKTIDNYLINNPHALLMVLKPEPGLQAVIAQKTAAELKTFKAGLNETQIDELIKETNTLIEHQKREDSKEALDTIPMLELADIGKEIEWFGIEKKSMGKIPILHHNEFSNDILYTKLYFDIRALPQELIPYASLLSSVLGKLNTEKYTFGELDNELNIYTGDFRTDTTSYLENKSDENLMPKFVVSSKATVDKADKLFELTIEILNRSKFTDTERLQELIKRLQAQMDSYVKNEGIRVALNRLFSYFSNRGMFNELDNGLEYYRFITDLSENFDNKSEEIKEKLAETASKLFTRGNLIAAVTCSDKDFPSFASGLEELSSTLPEGTGEKYDWKFDFKKKNEGLLSASKVQYVLKGYNFKKLGYDYHGKMRVLEQVLSTNWLQNQVRVIGGAYGGFCDISPAGGVFFASYRDPNLKKTLDTYSKTPEFLNNFEADEKTMTRYIIGTISTLDRPRTTSQKGELAVQYYFDKTTPEELKAEREAVLNTTVEDLKSMSKLVQDVLNQDAICVYGNEEKVKENEALFGEVVNLDDKRPEKAI